MNGTLSGWDSVERDWVRLSCASFPGHFTGGSKLKEVERPTEPRGCDSIKRKVCGRGLYTHFPLVAIRSVALQPLRLTLLWLNKEMRCLYKLLYESRL